MYDLMERLRHIIAATLLALIVGSSYVAGVSALEFLG